MGWWRTESGDTIGDDPADVVSEHLETLSQLLLAQRARKLTLGELLAHLHLVLTVKAGDLLAPGDDGPVDALSAEVETDDRLELIAEDAEILDDIRDRIDAMCDAISARYSVFLDRRPTTSEILASVRFVLGSQPDRFLEIAEDAKVRRIGSHHAT